jgi:tetratricopeptide (TPR) repeat protein
MAEEGRLTKLEVEYRARQALLKAHAGALLSGEGSASNHFDRAEEALLRVWEIHETCLGRNHPATAAACLSLGNLCVINKDLPQGKLWFESVIAILDACFSGACMQVTAATEAQFGHVEVKLGVKAHVASPHLERAADFYLARAQAALAAERLPSPNATQPSAQPSAQPFAKGGDGSVRRMWLARKAHALWTEVGALWVGEAKTNAEAAKKACGAYEKALTSVGAMHEAGGEASADALRLLLGSLKAFGSALEAAGNFRRATDAFSQLRTLSARLLGSDHKLTKSAAARARKTAGKVTAHAHAPPPQAGPAASPEKMDRTARSSTRDQSPEKSLNGEEPWLN